MTQGAESYTVLRRQWEDETRRLFLFTLILGVACGGVAVAFHLAIGLAEHALIGRALAAPGEWIWLWSIAMPVCGGLLAGVALVRWVPGARGSGIPQVKKAYALGDGYVSFRDALGKFVLSSLQIGSGASLGREGPTVQICAGVASGLGRLAGMPRETVRKLLPVGVAAGIAAAFNAPIAAVTFTIEEIVGNLDQAILSGVVIAAALAAVVERSILGTHPVIEVGQGYGLAHASSLAFYALLGIVAAATSVAFTDGLLGLRSRFQRSKGVPVWGQPAVGGLITGALIAAVAYYLGVAGINGGGYGMLSEALAGHLGVGVLLVLGGAKLVATIWSYSSGGAGGIFAPSLFVGAMLGGAVGHLAVFALGHGSGELGAFALVGMGAVFAGVVRAPITSVLIIFEMTGSYGLVLPLMLANMTAYMLARRIRPIPLYEALLAQDGVELPVVHGVPHPLHALRVSDGMVPSTGEIGLHDPPAALALRYDAASSEWLPVVDGARRLVGRVVLAEVRASMSEAAAGEAPPLATLVRPAFEVPGDAPLLEAARLMATWQTSHLAVVDAEQRLIGVLTMAGLVACQAR